MTSTFTNEPFRDFSEKPHRDAVANALGELDRKLADGPIVVTPVIAGTARPGEERFERPDPSDTRVAIAHIEFASLEQAEEAVQTCKKGFETWRSASWETRVQILRKAADLMRRDKAHLTAVIIREAGKPWKEADGDVAEAIDFCDYYAHLAAEMGAPRLTEAVLGEENIYFYQPRGVAVVISPWNFPLAITCGMAVAALVTGNCVILKPAEQTSLIAFELSRLLLEAGVPPAVLAFLPARGESVGRMLVRHKDVDLIAFTGSKAVGLEIVRSAAEVVEGQQSVKRVIAEMGGKNAVIVDEDADMDDAIRGVLYSAFGFSGQKCSACSRVLVVGTAYEPFVDRLVAATEDVLIGEAKDPSSFMGPVIDKESRDRILRTIESGGQTLKVALRRDIDSGLSNQGYFVPPTIFRDVPFDHPIWTEEIFGPVVACTRVASFEEAVRRATDSQYALTGGVYSRSPAHLDYARREFRVGNLYLNRGCTGALVCRQPFGGFKMSGIGSKAGGPDYLLQFVEPRVVSENTMRRGFTPDLA